MKVRDLVGALARRWRGPKTCEACGAEFTCEAPLAGCWCAEIKLSDTTRAELRRRFQDCLCRTCLERFAAEERNQLAP